MAQKEKFLVEKNSVDINLNTGSRAGHYKKETISHLSLDSLDALGTMV